MRIFWIFVLFAAKNCLARHAKVTSLYSAQDAIVQISSSAQFERDIYLKNNSFFVEFYASWCGHCINFAPTFKKFAQSVLGWNNYVRVAAVNCVAEENVELCRKHSIVIYPTFKYFKYRSSSGTNASTVVNDNESLEYLRAVLTQKVQQDTDLTRDNRLPFLGQQQNHTTENQLWQMASAAARHVVLVVEAEPSTVFVGVQSILEFSDHIRDVAIFVVSPASDLATKFGISQADSLPGLVIFERGSSAPIYASKEPHQSIEIVRQRILFHTKIKLKDSLAGVKNGAGEKENTTKPAETLFVHKLDLLSALRHIFYNEVRKFEHIRGDKLDILKGFMEVVVKYFPSDSDEQRFLVQLTSWLNSLPSELPSNIWVARLNQLQKENKNPLPEADEWRGCRGSDRKLRGFSCSVWVLFHAITVNAYQKFGAGADFRPKEIVTSFKLFIREFFGCKYCAENFQNETANLNQEIQQPADVVLYLWRVHNQVNERLKGQASEDPLFAKEQFPSITRCPECFSSDAKSWRDDQVLKFLLNFYSQLKTDDFGNTASIETAEKRGNQGHSSAAAFVLNKFDFSLCFLLWLVSLCIVLLGYYLLRKQIKQRCLRTMYSYNMV